MIQRIISCLLIIVALATSCKDDDGGQGIKTFNALADITGAPPLVDDDEKYNMIVQFSTDNGATFVDWPTLKKGDQYWAKVVVRDGGDTELMTTMCYSIDWSGSNPAPDATSGNMAQFTVQKDNSLLGKVVYTNYTPFVAADWSGKWGGDEVGDCCGGTDANTATQDGSDPNKFVLNNFWGDHVDATIIFTPSTSAETQVVTMPAQTTSEGGDIAETVGTYDQCTQTFSLPGVAYTIGGDTYVWDYNFHR